jgi:phosphocarrier protein HPr
MDVSVESEGVSDRADCEAIVEIKNPEGVHMTAALRFIETAESFNCNIIVYSGKRTANGKSILQMCMLAAPHGSKLRIIAQGPDCREAITALEELVEKKAFHKSAMDC